MGIDILIGHRLPLYREVLVSTIRAMRPDLVVESALQEDLDDAVSSACPWLVICSAVNAAILEHCPNWIAMFPDERDEAVVSLEGVTHTIPHAGVRELLEILAGIRPAPGIHPNG